MDLAKWQDLNAEARRNDYREAASKSLPWASVERASTLSWPLKLQRRKQAGESDPLIREIYHALVPRLRDDGGWRRPIRG